MIRDLRLGLRTFAREPGSTAAMILVLAVGLGAGTAVFSVLNEALLRMPPGVAHPERVVALERHSPETGYAGFTHLGFLEYRRLARSFSGMAAERGASLLLSEDGETSRIDGMLVTEGYFPVLGVGMAAGRDFLSEEHEVQGARPVAILSHAFWTERLGGDRRLVGSGIRLNGAALTVVGVTEPGFVGRDPLHPVDVWLPLAMEARARPLFPVLDSDFFSSLAAVARLAPGVDLEAARREMDDLAGRIERPVGPTGTKRRVVLADHVGRADPGWRRAVLSWSYPLIAAAGLLLAVIVVNLSGVLLARSIPRRKEMAFRLAVGAGRARLVRQLMTETLVLAVPAAVGGLLVARWVLALVGARLDLGPHFALDHRVTLFVGVLAIAACWLAAAVPALDVSGRDLDRELRDQGSTPRLPRLRGAFIAGQIAVSLTLLTVAGLLVRSFLSESAEDPGLAASEVYQAELDLGLAGFTGEDAREIHRRLVEEAAAVPGIGLVAMAGAPPLDRGLVWSRAAAVADGQAEAVTVQRNPVGPGYFEVLGTGLVAGRGFTEEDVAGAPRVAVVNETMAGRLRPGPVLGRTVRFPTMFGPGEPLAVVGVTRDVRVASRDETPEPEVLFPLAQTNDPGAVLLFRPDGDPAAVAAAVRDVVRRVVPALPPPRIESVRARRDRMLSDERLYAEIAGLFGLVGLFVAAIGVYGAISFDVGRRSRDLGVRISLGAGRGRVQAIVVREALRTAGLGVAAGLVLSLGATQLLRGLLHGVGPADPIAFSAATGVLVGVVVLTAWLSSRGVTRLDPAAVLRSAWSPYPARGARSSRYLRTSSTSSSSVDTPRT